MGLLDRFTDKFKSRPRGTSDDPTTSASVTQDHINNRTSKALESLPANGNLGILQHLLTIVYSDEELRDYLMKNKVAADLLLYCHHRFNGKGIPAELQYLYKEIAEVVQNYGNRILWDPNSGIRKLVHVHLKLNKGNKAITDLMDPKNNDLLLKRLASISDMIHSKEERFITVEKANFLLHELGLFEQNHWSTKSYLFYDKKSGGPWSKGTQFALSYLSTDVPLFGKNLKLFSEIVSEIPMEAGMSSSQRAYKYAIGVEEETLAYGLEILISKTEDLSNLVRIALRDRFTERHAMYWKWLRERASNLFITSSVRNSADFLDTESPDDTQQSASPKSDFLRLRESEGFQDTEYPDGTQPPTPAQSNFLPFK